MKLLFILFLLTSLSMLLKAQDTIIIENNYKYKIGIKFSCEGSNDIYATSNRYWGVYGGGIQLVSKIKKKISIESGLYFSTKAKEYSADIYNPYYFYWDYQFFTVYYHYISIPVNFRYDTKVIYVAGGLFFDYLLNHSTTREYLIDHTYNYGTDRKFNIGYNFAVGLEKAITRNINLLVEGKICCTTSSTKTDGELILNSGKLHPTFFNYGAAVGINYKL